MIQILHIWPEVNWRQLAIAGAFGTLFASINFQSAFNVAADQSQISGFRAASRRWWIDSLTRLKSTTSTNEVHAPTIAETIIGSFAIEFTPSTF
jgi:hypothetical protein